MNYKCRSIIGYHFPRTIGDSILYISSSNMYCHWNFSILPFCYHRAEELFSKLSSIQFSFSCCLFSSPLIFIYYNRE